MAENEPDRKDFKKEDQTEETTREVKVTEKQAQKESAKSAINNLGPVVETFQLIKNILNLQGKVP